MGCAAAGTAAPPSRADPFDLADHGAYAAWRARKLAERARDASELVVEIDDPGELTPAERRALLERCARWNMAAYRARRVRDDKAVVHALARQLGLQRLDRNWLADDDGVSSITVNAAAGDTRDGYIPYTDRPLQWHTDGYYHPLGRPVRAMLLHCVRPAAHGGANALLDHELAYIALRDASPRWLQALMAPDAMTVPARRDEHGVARPPSAGPVFSVDAAGSLHMRYTARTRSIQWNADAATQQAAACVAQVLGEDNPHVLRLRLDAGMGLVTHNVLHRRSGFRDDARRPRLLYRARFLDRVAPPPAV
ncbi:MAG: TauD/TfdA family dioxygenase [Ideonella sp.]|nr:TauD/TfdA family dioxygenase [Ideonella sp.]MCC7457636.1 TauD/TfdA family dioxygenase [Nitrospira sp.]